MRSAWKPSFFVIILC